MSKARVVAVRSVDIGVTDLSRALYFFTEIWHLERVAETSGISYLRASGADYYVSSLRTASRTGLIRIVLQAEDRLAVDRLYEQVSRYGQSADGKPRQLSTPGGGYGFGCRDPEGRNFAVLCDASDHAANEPRPDYPTRISHVNLNCRDNDATFKFLTEALGFTLSDHANNFRFLRCGKDHHSLVIGFNDAATLNHVAFEMPDLDSVMRGIGRMRDHGYPIEWGPGRHGPGNNVFAYFCGPEEFPLEYTAEMQQVDHTYRAGTPADWKWPPGRVDQWGIVPGPSARVKRAQRLFRFSDDGYRLD
jgi:catechol 2,3-dioxygenase